MNGNVAAPLLVLVIILVGLFLWSIISFCIECNRIEQRASIWMIIDNEEKKK